METPDVIKNYVEAWSNADVDSCIAPFGSGGTYCDPVVPKPTLAPKLKEHWIGFFSGFPDLRYETVGLDPHLRKRLGLAPDLPWHQYWLLSRALPRPRGKRTCPDVSSSKF
jgi:hypothetical protein